ncbi:MAG TPA: hypothetical protein VK604_20735, partial [Bryobacteraceae bacterium]|nr:hypothetical protein [Bryobacteraceae bacterium]
AQSATARTARTPSTTIGASTPTAGLTVPQGPADWLDTNLTNREMVTNFANAGTGPKIMSKFKSKIFSGLPSLP